MAWVKCWTCKGTGKVTVVVALGKRESRKCPAGCRKGQVNTALI